MISALVYRVWSRSSWASSGAIRPSSWSSAKRGSFAPKLEVGDQAVEQPAAALHHHKCTFLDGLRGDFQPGLQVGLQSAADDTCRCDLEYSLRSFRFVQSWLSLTAPFPSSLAAASTPINRWRSSFNSAITSCIASPNQSLIASPPHGQNGPASGAQARSSSIGSFGSRRIWRR